MDIKNLEGILKDFDERLDSENFGLFIDAYTPNKDRTQVESLEKLRDGVNGINELDFNSWN